MTNLEEITNDQMTNDGNLAFSAFDIRSPRRSEAKTGGCFVILLTIEIALGLA